MAEMRSASQTGEKEENSQAAEAVTGTLGGLRDAARLCSVPASVARI